MSLNALTWFEIPAQDLARAQRFYEQVLDVALKPEAMGGPRMALFPYEKGVGVGGCLMESNAPGAAGTLVYLNAGASLDAALSRVPAAGGRVALGRTALPPGMGFFAHVADTEGNVVGLHALA